MVIIHFSEYSKIPLLAMLSSLAVDKNYLGIKSNYADSEAPSSQGRERAAGCLEGKLCEFVTYKQS